MLYDIMRCQWNARVIYLDLYSPRQNINIEIRFCDNTLGIDAHKEFNVFLKQRLVSKIPVDAADLVKMWEESKMKLNRRINTTKNE